MPLSCNDPTVIESTSGATYEESQSSAMTRWWAKAQDPNHPYWRSVLAQGAGVFPIVGSLVAWRNTPSRVPAFKPTSVRQQELRDWNSALYSAMSDLREALKRLQTEIQAGESQGEDVSKAKGVLEVVAERFPSYYKNWMRWRKLDLPQGYGEPDTGEEPGGLQYEARKEFKAIRNEIQKVSCDIEVVNKTIEENNFTGVQVFEPISAAQKARQDQNAIPRLEAEMDQAEESWAEWVQEDLSKGVIGGSKVAWGGIVLIGGLLALAALSGSGGGTRSRLPARRTSRRFAGA